MESFEERNPNSGYANNPGKNGVLAKIPKSGDKYKLWAIPELMNRVVELNWLN